MKGSLDFVILIQILAKEWLFRILLSLGPAPGIREALKKCLLEERTALAHPFPKNQILSQKQILRLQVEGAFILSKALPTATEKVSPEPLSSAAWPPLSPRAPDGCPGPLGLLCSVDPSHSWSGTVLPGGVQHIPASGCRGISPFHLLCRLTPAPLSAVGGDRFDS